MAASVVACVNCGRKNRIRSQREGIPLLVLHRDGREVDRKVGALPPAALRQWLEPELAPPPPVTAPS